ncbi:hypothetical protein [Anabaena sp. CCY 9614]|uniref:hypothetical protein n=1 Tax=Anabaena sp. CCY 9614 TaxID=3103869 RepID=UPI0039C6D531
MRLRNKLSLFWLCFLSCAIITKLIFPQLTALASELTVPEENVNLITDNIIQINDDLPEVDKSTDETWEVEQHNSERQLPQDLKIANSSLPETENINEFSRISQIIPIEEFQVEPPQPTDIEIELEPEEDETPIPGEQEAKPETQPYTPKQQILIRQLRQSKNTRKIQQQIVLDALTFSANRYPLIVNPTDNFTFIPQLFNPNKDENYIDTDIRIRSYGDYQIINKFTYGEFLKPDQFYWVIDDNRIVIETKGSQAGIVAQGRETDTYITQDMTSEQGFWGLQSLFNIPTDFENLTGTVDTNDLSITSIAGQLINPEGIPAGRVIINSGVNTDTPNVTVLENTTSMLGSGSTLSSEGGDALFQYLDSINAPRILQGFPTNNLQPILDGGNVRLREGDIIPNSALEEAGILWGNILTGEGFDFTAPITSFPGVKIAQLGRFDNYDLLNVAVNPFLTQQEKDFHYLNSLQWVSLGKRDPQFETLSETQTTDNCRVSSSNLV